MKSAVIRGGIAAIVLAFPLAAICAFVYRFPIPFSGYESGLSAVPRALLAVLFYGVLGGFIALFTGGAFAGWAAYVIARPDDRRARRLTLAFAALVALLGVGTLAILDKLIGPW